MRKIVLGILAVLTIVITACAAQKKKTSKLDVTYVQMWRTSCFGRCPNYKIEIYKNGLVRYTGYQFTDTGVFEKNIQEAQAAQILNKFNEKRIDTLQKEYKVMIADLPDIQYTFKYGNTTKPVRNASFGPVFLRELADALDRLVKKDAASVPKMDNSWTKVSNSPKGD